MFSIQDKNSLSYFYKIRNQCKEIGYYGCDELYFDFPFTSEMIYRALISSYNENEDLPGIKTKFVKYISTCTSDEIILPQLQLNDYDVLEDIKVYNLDKNEYDFSIIMCDDKNGSCEMINDKTILVNHDKQYKIYFKRPIDTKEIVIEAMGYTFMVEDAIEV